MSGGTRICKVCGVEYEYCHTAKSTDGVFRWQDVACCEEHGGIYLAKVITSRTDGTVHEAEEADESAKDISQDDDSETI